MITAGAGCALLASSAAEPRLGFPSETPAGELHAAALRAAVHWRRRIDDPLLDPSARRALRAAVRSCEGVVAGVRIRAS
ncbi:hypothetical protein ACQP04_26335 [Pseudonocardia halophobica]|uniref:hypothetical protein n=1 Tax=Pseudonocardia halophobica TaxID=29401 RepID=UPI003D8A6EAA